MLPASAKPAAAGAAAGAGVAALASLLALRRYLRAELLPPRLIHGPEDESSPERRRVLLEVQLLLRDYWPHPVLEFSGYVATFWSGLRAAAPSRAAADSVLEVLTLRDGGQVSLHWNEEPSRSGSGSRFVFVLPGVNNDSSTSYIQSFLQHLKSSGFAAAALNYRGVGSLELRTPRLGGVDSWMDFDEVLRHVEVRLPGAELFAVGFSMGGGLLLRYLGEKGPEARFRAAVAVAAPVDLEAVGASWESSWRKRGMNFVMVSGVKAVMLSKIWTSPFSRQLDRRRLLTARTLRQLEEASICPLHGYKDGWDCYARNSPLPVLRRVAVPTLLLNAEDDPVVSVRTLPLDEVRQNPRLYLALTRRGGHIGWRSGGLLVGSWAEHVAGQFFEMHAAPRRAPRSRL